MLELYQHLSIFFLRFFLKRVRHPFLRVAETYKKESFCEYTAGTDSMNDEMNM